jgi:hypothetical protein
MNDTQLLVKIVGMFENESAAGNRLPMRKKISVKAWNLVLATLAAGATIEGACKVAGVSRRSAQRKRQTDPDFAEAWEEAMEAGTDALEDEAVRRAKDGYIKPVFHQGVKVGEVREYSDVLLMFMLKARRPEKFRDRYHIEHATTFNVKAAAESLRRKLERLWAAADAEKEAAEGDKLLN